jgi:hypothetical protein
MIQIVYCFLQKLIQYRTDALILLSVMTFVIMDFPCDRSLAENVLSASVRSSFQVTLISKYIDKMRWIKALCYNFFAIINDLDVILHGFMLLIIKTTVFRVKPVNSENRGINISYFHWHFHEIETFARAKTKRNRIITYIFRSKSESYTVCNISYLRVLFRNCCVHSGIYIIKRSN